MLRVCCATRYRLVPVINVSMFQCFIPGKGKGRGKDRGKGGGKGKGQGKGRGRGKGKGKGACDDSSKRFFLPSLRLDESHTSTQTLALRKIDQQYNGIGIHTNEHSKTLV